MKKETAVENMPFCKYEEQTKSYAWISDTTILYLVHSKKLKFQGVLNATLKKTFE